MQVVKLHDSSSNAGRNTDEKVIFLQVMYLSLLTDRNQLASFFAHA